MESVWPWFVLAGLGALHGAAPTTGWMFAVAHGLRAGGEGRARRALWPLAVGHAASILLVAGAVVLGFPTDRSRAQCVAGCVLVAVAAARLVAARAFASALPGGPLGLAAWSFLMATAHGAGLMLVPALAPLCIAGNPAAALTVSGSLGVAVAAVVVHTAAMLTTTGVVATGMCRLITRRPRWAEQAMSAQIWSPLLAATGVLLIALR